jgi:hypothetical protein
MRTRALTLPALCAGLLLAAACSSGTTETSQVPEGPAAVEAARLDEHRYLGTAFDVENLRIWPVHTDAPLDVGDFLTLQEAQEAGVAEVREVADGPGGQNRNVRAGQQRLENDTPTQQVEIEIVDEAEAAQEDVQQEVQVAQVLDLGGGATVGTLVIENKGDLPLLVCAGTVVKGGNQDRQIGQDIVVAAGETVPVDAFCVEAGRWTSVREGVAQNGQFVAMKALASKNVRAKGQYENDQSGVWQEVAATRSAALEVASSEAASSRRNARAQGTTFVDALEKAPEEKKEARERSVAAILAHFDALGDGDDAPIGFAYAVNGDPQGVRVFAHHRLFRKNLEAFATTLTVEAETAGAKDHAPCDAAEVVAMVRSLEKDAEVQREQTRAANFNVYMRNQHGFIGNCYVEDGEGREVPLTQDWTKK